MKLVSMRRRAMVDCMIRVRDGRNERRTEIGRKVALDPNPGYSNPSHGRVLIHGHVKFDLSSLSTDMPSGEKLCTCTSHGCGEAVANNHAHPHLGSVRGRWVGRNEYNQHQAEDRVQRVFARGSGSNNNRGRDNPLIEVEITHTTTVMAGLQIAGDRDAVHPTAQRAHPTNEIIEKEHLSRRGKQRLTRRQEKHVRLLATLRVDFLKERENFHFPDHDLVFKHPLENSEYSEEFSEEDIAPWNSGPLALSYNELANATIIDYEEWLFSALVEIARQRPGLTPTETETLLRSELEGELERVGSMKREARDRQMAAAQVLKNLKSIDKAKARKAKLPRTVNTGMSWGYTFIDQASNPLLRRQKPMAPLLCISGVRRGVFSGGYGNLPLFRPFA
jgi:hypothetical protein